MSIFRFCKWILEGKELELTGTGEQARDFTYVDDIARGTIAALKDVGYEIINLGGGNNPISMNTVIMTLEKLIGRKSEIKKLPFPKSDMEATWADISKASKILGWKPEISLDEGLARTVEWAKKNEKLLDVIKT